MLRPDYAGGSIVNLMSSIIAARGGESGYPPLRDLPPRELADAANIVLLVVDGLGAEWLARTSPSGTLSGNLHSTMTSVFPSTTASAITAYLTGDAPQQHGVTGWFTYLRELGCVMTVLPGVPRYGGVTYHETGVDPLRLFGGVPVSRRMRARSVMIAPHHIAHSDFNQAYLGSAELMTFRTLDEMFGHAASALYSAQQPQYLYLYWPGLDTIGHENGIGSNAAAVHLRDIETALAEFLDTIGGTDTIVLVTADHGQLDTTDADCIEVANHPELQDCLALPLCGEPRAAFCYLRPGAATHFEEYCREVLAGKVELFESGELLDSGLFGLGDPHLRLRERVGDYTLVMQQRFVIRDSLLSESRNRQVGVHGGLDPWELIVPLCILRPSP